MPGNRKDPIPFALGQTLRENGIDVEEEHFFAHMLNIKGRKEAAKEFGKKYSA